MPASSRQKTFSRREMEIKARAMNPVLGAGIAKMHSDVRLVGSLVFREPDIAINPHQRAAHRLRARHQPWTDLSRPQPEIGNELQTRLPQQFFITRFVLQKP